MHRVDDACELDQQAVAGRFDEAAAVRGDGGSISSRRSDLSAAKVPVSSRPISRE